MKQAALIFFFALVAILAVSLSPISLGFCGEYVVGSGDALQIKVYDNDDLTSTVWVDGEGMIGMPLLGSVKVCGLTPTEIARRLELKLADGFLVSPHVNVLIQEFRSQKVTILGYVEKPGLYELQGATSLLELISKAGGLNAEAGGQATIKKKKEAATEKDTVISVDLQKLVEHGDTSLNVQVGDGDSIYIPKAGVFFVTGEVVKPSSYKLVDRPTVIKAITMAGGLTEKAAAGKVRIIRKISGKEVILEKVNMDEPVLEDDVIVIPQSFF